MADKKIDVRLKRGTEKGLLWLVLGIITISIILALIFFIKFVKDPKNMVLSQSDLPSGFVPDLNSTGYKGEGYWNSTEEQYALSHGFKNGYYNTFAYMDPLKGTVTYVQSSVSIYDLNEVPVVFNESKKSLLGRKCSSFQAPGTWINSFGCYAIYNYSMGESKQYYVMFYKDDVIGQIFVTQNDTSTDLSGSAIKYAQIVANKI